ncbi:hypothetical protein KEM55_007888, partial [Ascosphaera atra]
VRKRRMCGMKIGWRMWNMGASVRSMRKRRRPTISPTGVRCRRVMRLLSGQAPGKWERCGRTAAPTFINIGA